jgi:hypothetical protein
MLRHTLAEQLMQPCTATAAAGQGVAGGEHGPLLCAVPLPHMPNAYRNEDSLHQGVPGTARQPQSATEAVVKEIYQRCPAYAGNSSANAGCCANQRSCNMSTTTACHPTAS